MHGIILQVIPSIFFPESPFFQLWVAHVHEYTDWMVSQLITHRESPTPNKSLEFLPCGSLIHNFKTHWPMGTPVYLFNSMKPLSLYLSFFLPVAWNRLRAINWNNNLPCLFLGITVLCSLSNIWKKKFSRLLVV